MATLLETPPVEHDSVHFRPVHGWFTDAETQRQWDEDLQAAMRVPALLVGIIFVGMVLMAIGVLLAISHV